MRQIKIGTYLRMERDKRTYGDILRHRKWREMAAWLRAQYGLSSQEQIELDGAKVIRYSGMLRQFHDIDCSGLLIRNELTALARKKPDTGRFNIAMHVRLGDFAPAHNDATEQSTRIPMDWYRKAFAQALELRGSGQIRGILFSDEDPRRVIDELGLEGFVPEPPGNALYSMLLMAQADILIGSRSTFSLWGQFLGDSHAIWPREFNLSKYKPVCPIKDQFV